MYGIMVSVRDACCVAEARETLATRFPDALAMGRELRWFEAVEPWRVRVADAGIGPVIDMHSHLALSYLLPPTVDLHARHEGAEHYLPMASPVDLDLYANRNFSKAHLAALRRDLSVNSLTAGGMRRTHTVPNLLADMADLGIERSVILPIDFPALSRNAEAYLDAARTDDRLVSFGSVHPWAIGRRRRLETQRSAGAKGIKLHPMAQNIRPDDPRAAKLYRLCGELGIPVLWHCGPVGIEPPLGRYNSQVRFYERPIADHPRTVFILGHSGALQFEQALALAFRYPNVYLETSSQGLPNVRRMVTEADPTRVVFGSDWPFYHQSLALAKLLIATEDRRELRRDLLYGNAAKLLGLAL